ncbi:hypothetical protein BYZ73_00500 [Rhodovulum viride]|uniref:Uncharacterized protein n=1 Tax=Rhodovulum viride TaxID=1231134 RepID=A0ABX9DLG8_9RHOB|nr:hypothetical protein [Rhodovulum viride]RAP43225.1 hypothetical protein BYZ73_00500 [Rhodovulum viride]
MKQDDKRTRRAQREVRFFVAAPGVQAEEFEMLDGMQFFETYEPDGKPAVVLDVEKYRHFLDDSALTEAQKDEVLDRLWQIVVTFVDLGFGVHPAQLACGKLRQNGAETRAESRDVLDCSHRAKERFEDAVLRTAEDESNERSP